MRRRIWLVSMLFWGYGSLVFAGPTDFQYWHAESLTWNVAKEWKLTLEEELYFQDDASDLYYQHTDLGVIYRGLAPWLDLGLNYRHVLKETKSDWNREEKPHINATVKWKWRDFSFSDRSRFEYRFREDADDFWQYRNNFTVRFPWKFTRLEIQPYFADEFYVDFDKEEINENRQSCGFSFKLTDHVSVEIYHMWRRVKFQDKWSTYDIAGTQLKFSF